MAREWDDEGLEDEEYASDDTEPCPYCGKPVYEGAERCPHCENYITAEDGRGRPRPWWFVVGMILALAVALMWAWGG